MISAFSYLITVKVLTDYRKVFVSPNVHYYTDIYTGDLVQQTSIIWKS